MSYLLDRNGRTPRSCKMHLPCLLYTSFDNIKWEKNCIQISQYKTNEPLVLPLFEDVGQAIIDYVKNGRPTSDLKLVFITHKPPFQKFSDNNHLYGMFNKYLYKAGIEVDVYKRQHYSRGSLPANPKSE